VRSRHKESFGWEVLRVIRKSRKTKDFPIIPENFPLDLTFTFQFKKSPLDSSNCSYMGKMIEDALVKQKVLPDDTIKTVRKVSYESRKGEFDRIYLTISE